MYFNSLFIHEDRVNSLKDLQKNLKTVFLYLNLEKKKKRSKAFILSWCSKYKPNNIKILSSLSM